LNAQPLLGDAHRPLMLVLGVSGTLGKTQTPRSPNR
jgi:hypothetical protein